LDAATRHRDGELVAQEEARHGLKPPISRTRAPKSWTRAPKSRIEAPESRTRWGWSRLLRRMWWFDDRSSLIWEIRSLIWEFRSLIRERALPASTTPAVDDAGGRAPGARSAEELVAQLREEALLELRELGLRGRTLRGELLDELELARVEPHGRLHVHADLQIAAPAAAQARDAALLHGHDIRRLRARLDLDRHRTIERVERDRGTED